MSINTNNKLIQQLLSRNIKQLFNKKELDYKLKAGKRLRIKFGIDPTGPKIHLGRAIPLWKLREFQDLGHQIVLILGDYTAQIGDPSDKLQKRPFLSLKQINQNLKNYQKQISKILDIKKIEWRRNSEWLTKLTPHQIDELAELFTVQQMLARRNFKLRLQKQQEISLRELHYPLYQGYDSVMVKADIEIGGDDQLFNLLAGRKVQEAFKQKQQSIMTLKMLEGLDGAKMSTSQGNVINIIDEPKEQYGKIMSMADNLIFPYFRACTQIDEKKIKKMEKDCNTKEANPMDAKAKLAFEIVKIYHNEKVAYQADQEFKQIFSQKELPSKIPFFKTKKKKYKLIELLVESKLASSKGEARRLIIQGGVSIDNKKIGQWDFEFNPEKNNVIKVGKRRFLKIK